MWLDVHHAARRLAKPPAFAAFIPPLGLAIVVAGAAALVPSLRATPFDPATVLRAE